jgi:hypothetical protein
VAVRQALVGPDGKSVRLQLETIAEGKVYEFQLSGVRAEDGSELGNRAAYYTLNRRLPAGSPTREVNR